MVLVRHIVDIQATPLTLHDLLTMAQAEDAKIGLVDANILVAGSILASFSR